MYLSHSFEAFVTIKKIETHFSNKIYIYYVLQSCFHEFYQQKYFFVEISDICQKSFSLLSFMFVFVLLVFSAYVGVKTSATKPCSLCVVCSKCCRPICCCWSMLMMLMMTKRVFGRISIRKYY